MEERKYLPRKARSGQALFAAGAGISSLREVTDQLEQEAAELFKSTGQLPKINKAIKNLKNYRKKQKLSAFPAKTGKISRRLCKLPRQNEPNWKKSGIRKTRNCIASNVWPRPSLNLPHCKPTAHSSRLWAMSPSCPLILPKTTARFVQAIREAELQLQKDTERLENCRKNARPSPLTKTFLSKQKNSMTCTSVLANTVRAQKTSRKERACASASAEKRRTCCSRCGRI